MYFLSVAVIVNSSEELQIAQFTVPFFFKSFIMLDNQVSLQATFVSSAKLAAAFVPSFHFVAHAQFTQS
jgi:hypothetical protein